MNLLSIKTGKVNTRTSTSECYVFFTPRKGVDPDNYVETFVGKAAREFHGTTDAPVRQHGSLIVVPSLGNMPAEVGGQCGQSTYQVKDGTILKMQAKKRVGWNGTWRSSAVFIRARENAAHRVLRFDPVPNNALAIEWLGIQGRFDILTLAEAEAFGAQVNPIVRKMAEAADEGVITCTILEEETVAPVALVEVGGGKVMPVLKRRRAIDQV